MPRNGSGGYSPPSNTWNPAVNGVGATAADWEALLDDMADALAGSVAADGQTPMTGNLNAGNNRLTSVASATSRSDAATMGQVQDGTVTYLTTVAGTNTVTASLTGLTAYATGQALRFVAAGNNTGATTLNVNGIGPKAITKLGTSPLVGGEIVAGRVVVVMYDGTQFQLLSTYVNTVTTSQTASGTAVDFLNIPSYVTQIDINFNAVSVSGAGAGPAIQLGDSGGIENSGYVALGGPDAAVTSYTTMFGSQITAAINSASGIVHLNKVSGNTWVCEGKITLPSSLEYAQFCGVKTLNDTLDRVRLLRVDGSAWVSGSFSLTYR